MTQDKSPNLQQYFENDPPSFFDTVNKDFIEIAGDEMYNESITCPVSQEVKDMWDYPLSSEKIPYTLPKITIVDIPDQIAEAVALHCPTELPKRKLRLLTADNVTTDSRGVRKLIEEKCYRSAIELTARLLKIYGDGFKHSTHSFQLWFTRLSLLVKIGENDGAKSESEAFEQLTNPDFYYEHKDPQVFKSKRGSMPSFAFRLFLAELPLRYHKPNPKLAITNLITVLETTKKIRQFFVDAQKETEMNFWKEREIKVLCSLINCAASLKNYDLTNQLFDNILKLPNLHEDFLFNVNSAWGRILLQSGDTKGAELKFAIQKLPNADENIIALVDAGLLAIAQNEFKDALQLFMKAHALDKQNIMILNNIAVCHLYQGKLHEAIDVYEKAILENPRKTVDENLILNLATLHELHSNESKQKKIELLKLINEHRADLCVPLEMCLKL